MSLIAVLDEFQDIRGVPEGDKLLGEMRGRIRQKPTTPTFWRGSPAGRPG